MSSNTRVGRNPKNLTKKELIEELEKTDIYMPRNNTEKEKEISGFIKILSASDAYEMLRPFNNICQESIFVFSLSGGNRVISLDEIARGTLVESITDARSVFHTAILHNAYSIIIAHNHPANSSHIILPSEDDNIFTEYMVQCGKFLSIPVNDHIVFSSLGYFSYLENDFDFAKVEKEFNEKILAEQTFDI